MSIGVVAITLLMLAITQGDMWGCDSPLISGLVVVGEVWVASVLC